MAYTVISEVGERLYRPNPTDRPDTGYLVFQNEDGRWSWLWQEPGEDDEFGGHFESHAEALRDVARNWDDCGGEVLPRFTAMLRGLATRLDPTRMNLQEKR